MQVLYELAPRALDDLDDIWRYIAEDKPRAADRVEAAILAACGRLARFPKLGTMRQELTARHLRFWTFRRYPNYVVAYMPETKPLRVVAILHGHRDVGAILPSRI